MKEKKDNPFICQTCYKSSNVLKAMGKYETVDGYPQCSDCHSDLESESVVIRQIHFDAKRDHGTPYPKWLHDDLEKKGLLKEISTKLADHQHLPRIRKDSK